MKTPLITKALPLMLLPVLGTSMIDATHAAPAKKAAVARKPAARQPKLIREVLGTEQLQGYEGAPGETFTIGKQMPLNFTLRQAEYSVNRANIGGNAHFPRGDEKLLILHYTVQNPQSKAFNYSSNYLTFRAVDSGGVTRNYVGDIARAVTGEPLRLTLNPGQKVDAYTVIKVAAFGEVPKLIVAHYYETKAPIVRYDLRGKVQKLTAPFADPADPKGATARKVIPANTGVFYPVTDNWDARLDSVTYSTEPLMKRAPGADKRYAYAIFTIKNKSLKPARYSSSYFRADLKDADGEKVDYNQWMLKASRDEQAGGELLPGEEARVRFYYELPKNVDAKTVLLQYGYDRESRTYAYDVSKVVNK
ncbi:MAG TPA: DUF4352 domain-containing protein [Abditibacteriaceae bacterium]|jgi:hypothetical protein